MKARLDFVTNSSSSSFIIGKKDEEDITIEFVYQIIRDLYIEYLRKRDNLLKYISNNVSSKIEYCMESEGLSHFAYTNCDRFSDKAMERDYALERDFGLSSLDYFEENYNWISCDTYNDYENYWMNQDGYGSNYNVHAPFSIYDFLNEKEVEMVHIGHKEKIHTNKKSDILEWYYEYINEALNNNSCENCWRLESCDRDECNREKQIFKNNSYNNLCLNLLGRICIKSECGYIPRYVVERLYDISECSCNHMG